MRRSIPRPVEIGLWIAFVSVCVFGVTSITDRNARELSASAAWAADQILNTIIGLVLGGIVSWASDHRFVIASWLVIVAGADIFALMLLNSIRSAQAGKPCVRLREWMELPVGEPAPAYADPLEGVNRRMAAVAATAGTAALAKLIEVSIWIRDVVVADGTRRLAVAAATGRVESRTRLESLREATAHLQFAARTWYAAAGEPALSGLASRTVSAARERLRPVALRPGEVVEIQSLLRAQSIGWYGPLAAPTLSPGEQDVAASHESDRLAS